MNDYVDDAPAETTVSETRLHAVKTPLRTGARIAPIVPRTYEEAWRIATHYVKTGMAPRDMKTPERVMIALMAGMEIGLPPIAALNNIAIINNRPRIWGAAVPALAINTGQLAAWDETVEGEGETMVARCLVARRVTPDLVLRKETTFSVADARLAGLWDERQTVERWIKNWDTGSKEKKTVPNDAPWHRYPKRMMQMRARQVFTDLFSDAFCGLGVAEVYLSPDGDAEMRDVTPDRVTISNPLQDDAEVAHPGHRPLTGTISVGDKVTGDEGYEGVIIGQVDGGGADTGDEFDKPTAPDTPKPPRQPRKKPQDEPKAAKAATQPEAEKSSPAQNVDPEDWSKLDAKALAKKTGKDYLVYLVEWTTFAVGFKRPAHTVTLRFDGERNIRNNLGITLNQGQWAEAKQIAAEAYKKLGGV